MKLRSALLLVALTALLTSLLVAGAPGASAHAYVIATTPANGAEVAAPPAGIRVTFQEPVTLPAGATSVLDETGNEVGTGSAHLTGDRRTLVIGVRPGLAKGSYIVSWSVVSGDSHPVGGSLQFGYGVPAVAAAGPAPAQPSASLQLLAGVIKGLLYVSLVAALGLMPAAWALGLGAGERRTLGRAARAGAALAILASLLQVAAQYLWDSSALPGGSSWTGLKAFAGTDYAAYVYVRVALLLTAAALLPTSQLPTSQPPTSQPPTSQLPTSQLLTSQLVAAQPLAARRPASGWPSVRARGRWAAVGGLGAGVLATVVLNGHGGNGAAWRFVSTLVHVGAVTAWLGGVAVLAWLGLRGRLTPGPRWSRYAAAGVALLALTGVAQAVVEVRYPAALFTTTYGRVLIVKLALVAVVLMLGGLNHRRVAEGRVWAEAGVGALVVVVSGVLSSVAPASAAYAPRLVTTETIGPYSVRIEIAPARRGPESFRITATGATPPSSVQLDLGSGAVRDLPVTFPYRLPGTIRPGRPTAVTFVSTSVDVPTAGSWTGTLTVVAGPTEQYAAAFTYHVL